MKGTINSPQLLMLSGIGPKDHLKEFGIPVLADLPVGHHLNNHPGMNINYLIKEQYQNLARTIQPGVSINDLHQYFANNSGPLSNYYNGFVYLSTRSNDDINWPNAAIESIPLRFPRSLDDFRAYR